MGIYSTVVFRALRSPAFHADPEHAPSASLPVLLEWLSCDRLLEWQLLRFARIPLKGDKSPGPPTKQVGSYRASGWWVAAQGLLTVSVCEDVKAALVCFPWWRAN